MNNHYNTTNETGQLLADFNAKAQSQEDKIISYLKSKNKNFTTTSSKLLRNVFDYKIPITSVRRSVSNLISSNKLQYTGSKINGMYGRPERVFKLCNL